MIGGRGRLSTRRPGLRASVLVLLLAWTACDRVPGASSEQVVELQDGEVRLPSGSQRHDVVVGGVGADAAFQPATIRVRPGDVVVFEAGDALAHSVAFDTGGLSAAQDSFLRASAQGRSPPLMRQGSRWIVSLDGAPPGSYTVLDVLHGSRARLEVGSGSEGGS